MADNGAIGGIDVLYAVFYSTIGSLIPQVSSESLDITCLLVGIQLGNRQLTQNEDLA